MMSLITRARKLEQLATCVGTWREAKCSHPRPSHGFMSDAEVQLCDGDNHLENCSVELARQDILAAHNALSG